MKAFKNIGIKEYFDRYGAKNGILRGLFMACPIHIVSDRGNRKLLYHDKIRRYIIKKCLAWKEIDPEGIVYGSDEFLNRVWVYWKQGMENAPEIVRVCIKSIREYGENVIVLTDQNISDYIELPNYVNNALKDGNLSIAMYSDLLRFSLLERYGGTWIDSTVLLTNTIPNYILKSDLFVFRDSCGYLKNPALMSNWMIHSKPHNIVIKEVRNILFEYCKRNKKVKEYLLSYIVLTSVLEQRRDILNKIPYASSEYSYLMMENLGCKYDSRTEDYVKELSSIHKLSYKLNDYVYSDGDNFYNHIVKA